MIPTFNECLDMCEEHGNMIFYKVEKYVQGFKIITFNYRFALDEHFIKPLPNSDITAHELRGICFIFNTDGTLYSKNIMLPKFWNIDQVEESRYGLLKDKEVNSVYVKRDGTMISFIKLPNGNIISRTKASYFDGNQVSDYHVGTMEIYNNDKKLRDFISTSLNNNLVPIFEYTSPNNRIVLEYDKSELTLLRLRNNENGDFCNIENVHGVKKVEKVETKDLEYYMELAKTETNCEGWVLEIDRKLYKQKTKWYFDLHNLYSRELEAPNIIIKLILNNEIDDVISRVKKENNTHLLTKIDLLTSVVSKYTQRILKEVTGLTETLFVKECNSDKKVFCLKYNKHKYFHFIIQSTRENYDTFDVIIKDLKMKTFRLEKCLDFLKTESKIK